MWQFEAARERGTRCSLRGDLTYVQYPKWVGFALDDRLKHWTCDNNPADAGNVKVEVWRRVLGKLDDDDLTSLVEASNLSDWQGHSQPADSYKILEQIGNNEIWDFGSLKTQILAAIDNDCFLQNALFERVVQSAWSHLALADAMRWLLKHSFSPEASHCQAVAITCGSLTALRVLLVEAKVNVHGFPLLQNGSSAWVKQCTAANGGWIQKSKKTVKALLARGAILGCQSSRSKLLKKLEVDGDQLWAMRVLNAIYASDLEIPEVVIQLLEHFLGLSKDSLE